MMLYTIARATVVARATNLLVKTWATVMPAYQVMARLPNDKSQAVGARLPNHSTLVSNVLSLKYNK